MDTNTKKEVLQMTTWWYRSCGIDPENLQHKLQTGVTYSEPRNPALTKIQAIFHKINPKLEDFHKSKVKKTNKKILPKKSKTQRFSQQEIEENKQKDFAKEIQNSEIFATENQRKQTKKISPKESKYRRFSQQEIEENKQKDFTKGSQSSEIFVTGN